jgi:hypothetical protein
LRPNAPRGVPRTLERASLPLPDPTGSRTLDVNWRWNLHATTSRPASLGQAGGCRWERTSCPAGARWDLTPTDSSIVTSPSTCGAVVRGMRPTRPVEFGYVWSVGSSWREARRGLLRPRGYGMRVHGELPERVVTSQPLNSWVIDRRAPPSFVCRITLGEASCSFRPGDRSRPHARGELPPSAFVWRHWTRRRPRHCRPDPHMMRCRRKNGDEVRPSLAQRPRRSADAETHRQVELPAVRRLSLMVVVDAESRRSVSMPSPAARHRIAAMCVAFR